MSGDLAGHDLVVLLLVDLVQFCRVFVQEALDLNGAGWDDGRRNEKKFTRNGTSILSSFTSKITVSLIAGGSDDSQHDKMLRFVLHPTLLQHTLQLDALHPAVALSTPLRDALACFKELPPMSVRDSNQAEIISIPSRIRRMPCLERRHCAALLFHSINSKQKEA